MRRLHIGAGWSAIKYYCIPYEDKSYVCNVINQHTLLLSELICEYYIRKAQEDKVSVDLLKNRIASMIPYQDKCIYDTADEAKDINDAFCRLFKKDRAVCAFVCDDDEKIHISKSVCRYQSTIEDLFSNNVNYIKMRCVPFNIRVNRGESASIILDVFKDYLFNEKTIHFIDQYIMNNIDVVEKYYFPMIYGGATLNIHTKIEDEPLINELINRAERVGITVHVFLYQDMHDRYITTDSAKIQIGFGLGFIDGNAVVKKGTDISIFSILNIEDNPESTGYERNLAGIFVKQYI